MAKLTLEYDTSNPDDEYEWKLAMRARDTHLAIQEYDNWLRGKIKYATDEDHEKYVEALEHARQQLFDYLDEGGVRIWE